MPNPRTPCIIGVAQKTWRAASGDAPHPLQQAEALARAACADSGSAAALRHVDELDLVLPLSWPYADPCTQLAAALELAHGARRLSGLSGTSPQRFLNDAAEAIVRGERDAVLVCGAEAFATVKRGRKAGRELGWPKQERSPALRLPDPPLATEIAHGVLQAYTTFALLDSARRAHLGLDLATHRVRQAHTLSRLSQVAAGQPHAWFQTQHTPLELLAVDPHNRMVAYPFTKLGMAIMDVDMAAAVLIASEALADRLGVDQDRRIYLHGWDHGREPPHVAQREALWHCPSLQAAAQGALEMAGTRLSEIEHLDLYSCFPSSLDFTRDALGMMDDDPRALTVTGGLPYFGGPGSNYTTHSVVSMVDKLRGERDARGLISGIGMHMTDHVLAVYGARPPHALQLPAAHGTREQPVRAVVDAFDGIARIVAYTVLHEGERPAAVAICELPDGRRCHARSTAEATTRAMQAEEWVGRSVTLMCNAQKVMCFGE